jgi:hypothetical protein
MAQPHNNPGSCGDDFLDYVPEVLIEQFDDSFNALISFVATTEATTKCLAVLPIGGSAIASSSQHVPSSDSNNNNKDNSCITNIGSIENAGWVDGDKIVEGGM